jgi:N-acetylmuramoyl-L-alanine amidase
VYRRLPACVATAAAMALASCSVVEGAAGSDEAELRQATVAVLAPEGTASAEGNIELEVEATAYTADCEGCSGITATGLDLKNNPDKKVIAVDPDVIPLGSTVEVEGYGEAVAGDVGSAIVGNKIDVFIPDEDEALEWGRQTITVKVLD